MSTGIRAESGGFAASRVRDAAVRIRRCLVLSALLLSLASACTQSVDLIDPDETRVIHVTGTPYEMGYQHGRAVGNDINGVFTEFLTAALLPYLGRDQPMIASFFPDYGEERFLNGNFGIEFLRDSSRALEPFLSDRAREEIRGIADGSGVDYDRVLIVNTLFDSILSLLNIRQLLGLIEAPRIVEIGFPEALLTDGIDNDEDGRIDEPDENRIRPFEASPIAILKGVPGDGALAFEFRDLAVPNLFTPEGVNLDTLRIRVNGSLFQRGEEGWSDNGDTRTARVTIAPPAPFADGEVVRVEIQAADLSVITDPPPTRPNVARMQAFVYLAGGADRSLADVETEPDEATELNPQGFTVMAEASATRGGETVVGRSMALLDANVLHKYAVLTVYHPVDDQGRPKPSYAVLGYAGAGWGLSGMSERGIVVGLDRAESLDDSIIGNLTQGKLVPEGALATWLVRDVLEDAEDIAGAEAILTARSPVTGWIFALADGPRDAMRVVEIDSNIGRREDGGVASFSSDPSDPANLAPSGRLIASVTPDDLRCSVHFQKNVDDFPPLPQRQWASTYFKSLKTSIALERELTRSMGSIDAAWMMDMMRGKDFVHEQGSMHNAVFLPDSNEMYVAMGRLPAVDGPFRHFGPEIFERPAR